MTIRKGLFAVVSLSLLLLTPSNGEQLTAPSIAIPPDYFGMHIHKAAKTNVFMPTQGRQGGGNAPTPWPRLSFGSWRLWDAGVDWSELEPAKDEWQFELLDKYVELAREHDADILLTLGQTPAWASSRPEEKQVYQPGNAAEPRSLDDWRKYVRTVATRYKGAIHEYEIWNEPNLKQFYTGTPGALFDLTREAAIVLKEIDPSILVVSPSVSRDYQWLARYFRTGAGKYTDVVGFHFYVRDNPEEVVGYANHVKQVMRDNDISGKPLWNTEAGWGRWQNPKLFPNDNEAAAYVARSYILNWAAGISRFYWYAWDNFWWVTLNMTEPDRQTEKPAAQAYRVIRNWLVGAVMKSCESDAGGTWQCDLTRRSVNSRIVWNPEHSGTFSIPLDWNATKITNLSGAALFLTERSIAVSQSPVLIQ